MVVDHNQHTFTHMFSQCTFHNFNPGGQNFNPVEKFLPRGKNFNQVISLIGSLMLVAEYTNIIARSVGKNFNQVILLITSLMIVAEYNIIARLHICPCIDE